MVWSAFAQFKKNADAARVAGAGCRRTRDEDASGLRTVRRDRLPGNKRPADLADMVEHVATLRHAF